MSHIGRLNHLLLSLWVLTITVPTAAQEQADIVILGGQVFDSQAKAFKPNRGIAVKGGKFVALGNDAKAWRGVSTIQVKEEQFILPGIVDCHAHYNVRLIRKRREEFEVMPIVYLANGVTITYSCGEFDPERMWKLRKEIESNKQIGPRLINSGPYFGRARPGWRGIKSPSQIKQEVDFWVSKGVGGFKAKAISPEELRPLIERGTSSWTYRDRTSRIWLSKFGQSTRRDRDGH